MPSELRTAKTFFLISGIVNILVLLGWSGTVILGGLITCGIGCLAGFVPLINVASCILDFIAYNKLERLDRVNTYQTLHFAAIMEIITILSGNVISLVFGIMTLTYLGNDTNKAFLKEKGIY